MSREDILLREYEVCQQSNDAIGSEIWVSTTVFLSINVALLGGGTYGIISVGLPPNAKWLVLALGLGIILIFVNWIRWLNRMQFLTSINYERMREIETELGMWKNWKAFALDRWDELSNEQKEKLADLRKRYPHYPKRKFWKRFPKYAPPAGFDGLRNIALLTMSMWAVFTLMTFFLFDP